MARQGRYGIYKPIILKNNVRAPVNYTITVDTGLYNLTGQDVNLVSGRNLTADTGQYALTGQDVNLIVGKNISVDTGFYDLVGSDVDLIYTPFVPPIPIQPSISGGGSSSGISMSPLDYENEQKRERIKIDDENIINVLKLFFEECL